MSRRWGSAAVVAIVAAALVTACAPRTPLVVDSTADTVDALPGDGACADAAGDCTLRAAVQEANATAVATTIVLAPGATYELTLTGVDDAAASGDLDVTGDVQVVGQGATVDANGIDRVVEVRSPASLWLSGVTVTGGVAEFGGGIVVRAGAVASITDSTIVGNEATGHTMCTKARNIDTVMTMCSTETTAVGQIFGPYHKGIGGGGGIHSAGELHIWSSTISSNRAGRESLQCYSLLRDATCETRSGGGVLVASGHTGLANVTISGNVVEGGGGAGIAVGTELSEARLDGVYVTIHDNTSTPGTPSFEAPNGSAIGSTHGIARLARSAISGAAPVCGLTPSVGGVTGSGFNRATDSSCELTDPTDLVVADLALGPLSDNGGSTATHLPLVGSPLLGAAPAPCGVPTDQRGTERSGTTCAIGAVEPTSP